MTTLHSSTRPLTAWAPGQAEALGAQLVLAEHHLGSLPLFRDEALAQLLDRHPRQELQAFTMGRDPVRTDKWSPVDIADASGADLLAVVQRGRLWLNILRVDRSHPEFADLQTRLFDEIAARNRGLEPGTPRSTLLVSSPSAQVYFHVDAGPNALWHVRGQKRVFVYPALDNNLVDRATLEDIYAAAHEEMVPYRREFDGRARVVDLAAGQMISWPQNSPHRVANLDGVNVSLSCEFATAASRRREYLWGGNRFLSRSLRLPCRSTRETGSAAAVKRLVYRAASKARLVRSRPQHVYETRVRVDPDSPEGLVTLGEPVRTAFSLG